MDITARPWATSGFVATVVGASALAAPVAPPTTILPDVQSHAVRLVSGDVTWDQVLQTALANSTDIYDHLSPAAFADVQQFAANVPAYLDGGRNFETDLGLAYSAATNPFVPADPEPYIYTSVDPTQSEISIDALGIFGSPIHLFDIDLPGKDGLIDILTNGLNVDLAITSINIPILSLLVGDDEAAQITPYLEFSGSPLSGILWGSVGTTLSPLLQIQNDFSTITTDLGGASPDYTAALNELADLPANVTNAFLNGYGDVNLDTLLTDFGISDSGVDVSAIQLDLGGLLSPGGSLIDGIGISDTFGDCSIACATLDVPSSAVGPIASLFEQDQAIAEAIGWDGVGQPLAHLFTDLTTLLN
jgi:hypothetical protein